MDRPHLQEQLRVYVVVDRDEAPVVVLAVEAARGGLVCPLEPVGADDVGPREDALEVVCRAILEAPLDLVWQTLTDYDRLAEFIPGMRGSRSSPP